MKNPDMRKAQQRFDELIVGLHDGDEAVDRVKALAMELNTGVSDDRYEEIVDDIAHWVLTGTFVRDNARDSAILEKTDNDQ